MEAAPRPWQTSDCDSVGQSQGQEHKDISAAPGLARVVVNGAGSEWAELLLANTRGKLSQDLQGGDPRALAAPVPGRRGDL